MSRRSLRFLAVAWLGLAVFTAYETRVAFQQRTQREALVAQTVQLNALATALRAEGASTTREIADAERQLGALPAPPTDDPQATPARQKEIAAWLARMKRLRQLFDERPAQRIPEMQFLTDEDWLRSAKTAQLESDDDIRRAMAQVRTAASAHFISAIATAVRNYGATNKTDKPASIAQLAAYFDPPVDPLLLGQYEVVDGIGAGTPNPASWGVRRQAPIDADYDSRPAVTTTAGRTGSRGSWGPLAWDPDLSARYTRALRDYARSNSSDQPRGIATLLPFFNPPLEPALAERLIRVERR